MAEKDTCSQLLDMIEKMGSDMLGIFDSLITETGETGNEVGATMCRVENELTLENICEGTDCSIAVAQATCKTGDPIGTFHTHVYTFSEWASLHPSIRDMLTWFEREPKMLQCIGSPLPDGNKLRCWTADGIPAMEELGKIIDSITGKKLSDEEAEDLKKKLQAIDHPFIVKVFGEAPMLERDVPLPEDFSASSRKRLYLEDARLLVEDSNMIVCLEADIKMKKAEIESNPKLPNYTETTEWIGSLTKGVGMSRIVNGHRISISKSPDLSGQGRNFRIHAPGPEGFKAQFYPTLKEAKAAAEGFARDLPPVDVKGRPQRNR